jgi:tetraacyldisaccharide 4'-kinase
MKFVAPKFWYQRKSWLAYLFLPFSLLYILIIKFRKLLYKIGINKISTCSVPIIVVGNITVGGTGKTPFVIYLVNKLKEHGYAPGVVSRGYRSAAPQYPWVVQSDDTADICGDEPLLIYHRTACPVVIAPNRVAAVDKLLATHKCNIIVSDDGLQHYALGRDIEVLLADGVNMFGNQFCLPAGPLREPISRLNYVDFIVVNNGVNDITDKQYQMQICVGKVYNLVAQIEVDLNDFKHTKVHAVAGIANPDKFFAMLQAHEIDVIEHPFPDHHKYIVRDLQFDDNFPVLMTEKDAVKCLQFSKNNHWCVAINAQLPETLFSKILSILNNA